MLCKQKEERRFENPTEKHRFVHPKRGRLNLAKDKKVFPHPGPIIHRRRGKYRVYVVKGLPQVLRGTGSKGGSQGVGVSEGRRVTHLLPKSKRTETKSRQRRPKWKIYFGVHATNHFLSFGERGVE